MPYVTRCCPVILVSMNEITGAPSNNFETTDLAVLLARGRFPCPGWFPRHSWRNTRAAIPLII